MQNEAVNEIVVQEESQIYKILEEKEEQLMLLETSELTGQALIYEVTKFDRRTNQYIKTKEPTFAGINWLVIHMTQNMKQGLVITPNSLKMSVQKFFDPVTKTDKEIVTCAIQILNEVTHLETVGLAEQPLFQKVYDRDERWNKIPDPERKGEFLFHYEYDEFAQRKALSKALRNAWRLQFPPEVLARLVKIAESKGMTLKVRVDVPTKTCSCFLEKRKLDPSRPNVCLTCNGRIP